MRDDCEQLEQALMDGTIDVTCPKCRCELVCEPDAETVYCEVCRIVVTPKDSLVAKGLM